MAVGGQWAVILNNEEVNELISLLLDAKAALRAEEEFLE